MQLAFTTMNTPEDVPPDVLGRALEDRGFAALWIGEHSHIPTSRTTPYPAGGDLPAAYRRMMDPFLSLLAAALATTTLRVGTGVALPLEHDLFSLAKAVTTLDRLSGGRFDFGVGVGWNEEELADHRPDVPWAARYQALAECVAALRALWVEEEPTHHGRWFDFDAVWAEPKPLQSPHPPVVGGMAGRVGTEHVVAWADAWMPMDLALGDVAKRVRRFRDALADAGRPPVPIILGAWGDPTREQLLGYADLGVEQVVLGAGRAGWDDPATALPFVDRYAPLVGELADA
ncbi:MAG: TIGR03619 family F420-dependent LLM class oxidoreductase [Acidimicrobiales bacterium]